MSAPSLPGPAYQPINTPYPPSNIPYPPQSGSVPLQYTPQDYSAKGEERRFSDAASADGNFQPSAPPLESIQKAPGYEKITFASTILPPPANPQPQQPQTRGEIQGFSGIMEEDIRDAAIQYASEHCCYGKDTVRDMVIKEIVWSSAFHYTLETFGEKRETAWCYDPYDGEPLDTVQNGIPPGPWEIPQMPPKQFKDFILKSEVPHTASAMPCHVCIGFGRERCDKCEGFYQEKCTWCNGSGKRFIDETCTHCNGDGKSRCTKCCGTGQMNCRTCSGKGSLKCYVKLTTTWKNHTDDYIFEQTDLPDELIRNVTGQVVFQEEYPRVWPVNHFPQHNINEASKNLITKHNQEYNNELILQQRHKIRIVPVAQVHYIWKDNHGKFFVYGFENEVYFPDYPQSCCWGCTIL